METNPILQFKNWYAEHLAQTKVELPAACCLSTIGTDGYPNARFVSLKEVKENGFVVTGTVTSRKGIEIGNCNKVALSFWWAETGRQVRIQGDTQRIMDELADAYFSQRNRDSQIVSVISKQGEILTSKDQLEQDYDLLNAQSENIARPENWGGYLIIPRRIEFMEFKPTRFHDRTVFRISNGKWIVEQLQP